LLRSGSDEHASEKFVRDTPEMEEWVRMLSEFYPSDSVPADWFWPRETLKLHFPELDMVDIAFFCIVADLSDRFVDAISPMKNHAVLAAYKQYFDKPIQSRRLAEFETLVSAILTASRTFRSSNPQGTIYDHGGMHLLEWCMLADALNNSKLGGDSADNILMSHSNEGSWKNFKACAVEFELAAKCTDQKLEYNHFKKGAKELGIKSKNMYRPLHIYRLYCFLVNKKDSGVNDWFKVNSALRCAFKERLSPFLAAVAACQCAKVPRTRDNFTFLNKVAQDRAGFLQVAANLTEEEKIQVRTLLHFGPARFVVSTTKKGLLSRAYKKYRQQIRT
jgi:hypothetical protein